MRVGVRVFESAANVDLPDRRVAVSGDWHGNVGWLRALAPAIRRLATEADANVALTSDDSASAHVACTVETATPIEDCGTLVEMARAQGEGFVTRSERRMLRGTFVKRDGIWKIATMELVA